MATNLADQHVVGPDEVAIGDVEDESDDRVAARLRPIVILTPVDTGVVFTP